MAFDDYQTNDKGIITSPGKFEGEPLWLAGFYEYMLQGAEDGLEGPEGNISVFLITDEDRALFSHLPADVTELRLWTDDQGFLHYSLEQSGREVGGPAEGVPGVEVPQ